MSRHSPSTFWYALNVSSVAALGGFLFGFDSGVINGTVVSLAAAFGSSAVGTGFSVASMLLGCAVGALVVGPAADRWGRKPMLMVTALLFALSAFGSGIATSATEFVVYRLLGGCAVGAASVLSPAYISEIAPPRLRGRLASLQQLAIVLGILGAFVSNYFLALAAGGASEELWLGIGAFRWMFWVELLPAVALLVGAVFIPESPRYLVRAGRLQEATRVFSRVTTESAEGLVQAVQRSIQVENRPGFRDLIDPRSGGLYPIVWVGIFLSIFQQAVGINVVFYYGEMLWRAAGFTEAQALQVNLLGGTVNVLSTFVAMALIDRVGRKPLLLGGSLGMVLALTTMAVCFSQGELMAGGELTLGRSVSVVALVAANLYVFCFGVSWGPCVWVLLGEMFPNQFRGAALSLGASAQWLANFVVTMSFPIFLATMGLSGAYGLYAFCAGLSIVFVWRFVAETKGRALEEMGAGSGIGESYAQGP